MAENYEGVVVENKGGNVVDLSQFELVGYYFSASWCPPCRGFTPILDAAYKQMLSNNCQIELVLVSSDQDPTAAAEYYKKMSFCMLDFNNTQKKSFLSQKYKVSGIPCLVIVHKSGKVASMTGVEDVRKMGDSAFEAWLEMAGVGAPPQKEMAKPVHSQAQFEGGSMTPANNAWIYDGCITMHQMSGEGDWAYGHNRMTDPGVTDFHVTFLRPVGNQVKIEWMYFAPWQMSPCSASASLNGQVK